MYLFFCTFAFIFPFAELFMVSFFLPIFLFIFSLLPAFYWEPVADYVIPDDGLEVGLLMTFAAMFPPYPTAAVRILVFSGFAVIYAAACFKLSD